MTSRSSATSGQTNTLASRYNQRPKWGKCVFSCEISFHAFGFTHNRRSCRCKNMVHNGNQRGLVARGDGLSERGFWVEKLPSMIVKFVYGYRWNMCKKRKVKDKWRLKLTWRVGSVSGLMPVAVWGGVGRSWWRVVLCCQGILSTGRQPDAKK